MKHAKLGSGVRFAAVKAEISRRGLATGHPVKNPSALAAFIGRKAHPKTFQKLAAKGRRRHGNQKPK